MGSQIPQQPFDEIFVAFSCRDLRQLGCTCLRFSFCFFGQSHLLPAPDWKNMVSLKGFQSTVSSHLRLIDSKSMLFDSL